MFHLSSLHLPCSLARLALVMTCTIPTSWRQVTAPTSNVVFVVWGQNATVAHASYFWASLLPWISSTKPKLLEVPPCGCRLRIMGDANEQLSSFFFLQLGFSKMQQLHDAFLEMSSKTEQSAGGRAVVGSAMRSLFSMSLLPSLMPLSSHSSFVYSWIECHHVSVCFMLSFLGNLKKAKAQHNN